MVFCYILTHADIEVGYSCIKMTFSPQNKTAGYKQIDSHSIESRPNWVTLWFTDLEAAVNKELHVCMQWGTYIKEQKLQCITDIHYFMPYMHIY